MKQFNTYILGHFENSKFSIIEKLKINKDTNTNSLIQDGLDIYTYDQFKDWLHSAFNFENKRITWFLNNIIHFENTVQNVSYNYHDYKFIKYDDHSKIKNDFFDKKINIKIKNFKENRNRALYYLDDNHCLFYTRINKSHKIKIDTAIPFVIITDKEINKIENIYILSEK